MVFVKEKITVKNRLRYLKTGIEYLATSCIPVHDGETDKWSEEHFPVIVRWDYFFSCVVTAIIGYVYRWKKNGVIQ